MTVADLMERVAKQDADGGWSRYTREPDVIAQLAGPQPDHPYQGRRFHSGDSLSLPELRLRYVSMDSPYAPYTAGELARAWLQTILERNDTGRLSTAAYIGGEKFGPSLFFDPPADRGGEWVMIDVKACYWTLYSRLDFDCRFRYLHDFVEYNPGRIRVPDEDKPWVGTEKPLRNAAWGAMSTERIQWTENGVTHSKPARSRFRAPGLTQAVLAQIQAVATECRIAGAVMFLTDAAVCRPELLEPIAAVFARWGLAWDRKEPPVYLYGLGDYRVASKPYVGQGIDRGSYDGLQPLNQATRDRLATL
jgi:hypothetical protein